MAAAQSLVLSPETCKAMLGNTDSCRSCIRHRDAGGSAPTTESEPELELLTVLHHHYCPGSFPIRASSFPVAQIIGSFLLPKYSPEILCISCSFIAYNIYLDTEKFKRSKCNGSNPLPQLTLHVFKTSLSHVCYTHVYVVVKYVSNRVGAFVRGGLIIQDRWVWLV